MAEVGRQQATAAAAAALEAPTAAREGASGAREAHLYDWLRARGYWLRPQVAHDPPATHLLLDGGKARVPDEAHAEFLNAYAVSLARAPGRRPCVAELRTPVFRMFVDLDTRFRDAETAVAAVEPGDAMRDAVRAMTEVLRDAETQATGSPTEAPEAIACVASEPKAERDGDVKLGMHVVWPDVLVGAPAALELRRRMVEVLDARFPPADLGMTGDGWGGVVDATVFRSNGLRMPWSDKGRGDRRFYRPRWRLEPGTGEVRPMRVEGVGAVRDALRRLSVRTFGRDATLVPRDPDPSAAGAPGGAGGAVTPASLAAYSDVLPELAAALPVQFAGQRFTGLVVAERCFMLRSTARFCFNLGRAHRTNNVYFVLTRRGVSQRCYCRCETAEGRRHGMCMDFASEAWPVPRRVTDAFFPPGGDDEAGDGGEGDDGRDGDGGSTLVDRGVRPMPSRSGATHASLSALLARARPPAPKRRRATDGRARVA